MNSTKKALTTLNRQLATAQKRLADSTDSVETLFAQNSIDQITRTIRILA